ncbi:MAG: hypothetical protein LBV45_05180 [Xanthomonadaceae bacterium]|jgi:hypothetical protein|nr:hypothetical protein [Xanthomonadaceae bacterium]
MSANTVVENLLTNVPKAVAAGVIDIGTGTFLAIKSNNAHPQNVQDLVPATIKAIYEGQTASNFQKTESAPFEEHFVREALISARTHLYVSKRLEKQENIILVVAAEMDMSNAALFSLVLMKLRDIANQTTI